MIAALALLLASSHAAPAAAPAPTPPAGAAQQQGPAQLTPAQLAAAFQQMGFSPTAVPLLVKAQTDDRTAAQAAQPDLRAGSTAVVNTIQASPFNPSAFETQMRAQEARVARLRDQNFQHQLAVLRSLPAGDQQLYARLIVFGVHEVPAQGAGATTPAAPAKR